MLCKKSSEGKGEADLFSVQDVCGVWQLFSTINTRKHCRNGMKSKIMLPVCVFPSWLWWASRQDMPAAAVAFLTVAPAQAQAAWYTC